MRNRASLTVTLLAGGLAGCFSSSSSGPPTENDAETPPVTDSAAPPVDATVPSEAAPEASLPEAAPEAAVEAGPLPVKVTIVNHLGPEPGVLIVFQDVNGNVVTTATTDIAGQVTQPLGSATQVTALTGNTPPQDVESFAANVRVYGVTVLDDDASADGGSIVPSPANVNLVTVQGVEPGDTLTLSDPSDTTFQYPVVSIDALPDGGPAAAQSYSIGIGPMYFGTTTSSFPYQIELRPGCESNGEFPVFVVAVGGPDAGGANLAYTWQTGNVLPPDGGTAHVVMTGPWATATTTQTVTALNVPDVGYDLYASYSEVADNVGTSTLDYLSAPDGSAYAVFTGHPPFPTSVQSEVSLSANFNELSSVTAIATSGPFVGDAGDSFDLSTALPFISSVTLDAGLPTSDAAVPPAGQPYVSWSTGDAGSLASVSGVVVQASWYDYCDGCTSMQSYGTWTIVVPPSATSVTAPALPPEVAGWGPSQYSNFENLPLVVAVQSSLLPNYTAFRNQFASLPVTPAFQNGNQGPYVPPLPTPGTLRLTAATTNGD
jgi:hypothetical protein